MVARTIIGKSPVNTFRTQQNLVVVLHFFLQISGPTYSITHEINPETSASYSLPGSNMSKENMDNDIMTPIGHNVLKISCNIPSSLMQIPCQGIVFQIHPCVVLAIGEIPQLPMFLVKFG